MKNSWLFLALFCLFLIWSKPISPYVSLLLILIGGIYYLRHYRLTLFFLLVLGLCLIRIFQPVHTSMPKDSIVEIQEIKSGYAIAGTGNQKVILYQAKGIGLQDVVALKGDYVPVDSIHNIRMFSFTDWLKRRNIYYQMKVESAVVIKKGSGIRRTLYDKIGSLQDKSTRDFAKLMLYGIHEEDVSFFLTSSGLHISYLFYIIQQLLIQFLSKTMASILCLVGIGSLAYATVLSSSLIRILCFRMTTLCTPSYSAQDRIGISVLLTLMLAPYMAYELALLLPLTFRLSSLFQVQRRSRQLVSFLILIPYQFLYFHMVNPLQLLLFRVYRILYAGLYALCLCVLIFPLSIGVWTVRLLSFLDEMQNLGIVWYYTPALWWLVSWFLHCVALFTHEKWTPVLPLSCLLLYAPYASYLNPFAQVVMIDVGQGDSTLIILPFHQGTMLIDVMGSRYKNVPKDIIVPVLKAKGIHALDTVILTHSDYDHSGGLPELLELMDVKEVIKEKRNDMMLGDLKIPFLLSEYKGKDANDNSIVTYLSIYDTSVLFMGDAGIEAEEQLLKDYPLLKADVLKAGHHGSRTSSSYPFLHQVHPQLALISSGRNNRYGHPHPEPLAIMKQEGIHPLITSHNGAVALYISKYFSYYVSADHEIGLVKYHLPW